MERKTKAEEVVWLETDQLEDITGGGSFEHKSYIMSSKNFRNVFARVDASL